MNQKKLFPVFAFILIISLTLIAGCSTHTNPETPRIPTQNTKIITIPPTTKIIETTQIPTIKPTPLPKKSVTAKAWQNGNDIIIEYLGGPGHQYVDEVTWEVFPGKAMYQTIEGMGTYPLKSQKGYDLSPKGHFTATVEGLGTSEKDHVVIIASYNISPFFETILDTYV
jgi:hypothetical protein